MPQYVDVGKTERAAEGGFPVVDGNDVLADGCTQPAIITTQ
jgi:hypothetical protein